MARSIWSGAISFGLVNVPVKLYSAVSRKTVRFNQLNAETGNRIQQKRVDPDTGEEVSYDQIVKGFELTKDRYVVITPDELDALDPERTRTVDIEDFVDLADIDPIYYDHPYYLVPDKGTATTRPRSRRARSPPSARRPAPSPKPPRAGIRPGSTRVLGLLPGGRAGGPFHDGGGCKRAVLRQIVDSGGGAH